VISPNSLKISKNWWIQFPYHLRLITKIRFYAAFGAGGVIYLTSLIFNNIGLSATDIGLGFTISAIIGTVTRLFTGNYLNKTGKIQFPIVTSSILSIAASLCLIFSRDTFLYIIGQSFVGAAAGIYWPAAEFGVPYFCHPIETRKAYALVRSSEALGIFLGVLIGGYMTNFLFSKSIFINDIFCMLVITYLISRNSSSINSNLENFQKKLVDPINKGQLKWNKNSTIIILSILLITTSLALIQVTLPLDLVKGGVYRNALSKEIISLIISIQLNLFLITIINKKTFFMKKENPKIENPNEELENSSNLNKYSKWVDNQGDEVKNVFGFNSSAELVNGRAAMIGFLMLILTELVFKGRPVTSSIFGIN